MDGYLDQQVPYTLANVRIDKVLRAACFVSVFRFYRRSASGVCTSFAPWQRPCVCAPHKTRPKTYTNSATNLKHVLHLMVFVCGINPAGCFFPVWSLSSDAKQRVCFVFHHKRVAF